MPSFFGQTAGGQMGVPNVARALPIVRNFQNGQAPSFAYPYAIRGVTRDSTGVPQAGAKVQLFRTIDDTFVSECDSDANGAFTLYCSQLIPHYIVAYKPGSPDIAGTTVNTLISS